MTTSMVCTILIPVCEQIVWKQTDHLFELDVLWSLHFVDFKWKQVAGTAVRPDSAIKHQMDIMRTVSYAVLLKDFADSDKHTTQTKKLWNEMYLIIFPAPKNPLE